MLDLVFSGEASKMADCDRRTFISWAKKLKIEPAATVIGKKLYERHDASKIAKAYKNSKLKRG